MPGAVLKYSNSGNPVNVKRTRIPYIQLASSYVTPVRVYNLFAFAL